jgi:predicted transcriptional regulator
MEFPLSTLAAVAEARRVLDTIESRAVRAARERGATWEDIAEEMGLTRQAVFQRYRESNRTNHARS